MISTKYHTLHVTQKKNSTSAVKATRLVRTKDQEEEKSKRYKYVKNNNDFYIDIWEEKRSRTTENKREKRI